VHFLCSVTLFPHDWAGIRTAMTTPFRRMGTLVSFHSALDARRRK